MSFFQKFIMILILLASFEVSSNDGYGIVGTGGIILSKTHDIAMAKEVLDIGIDKVVVEYNFVNESSIDIKSNIVFPLPKYLNDMSRDVPNNLIHKWINVNMFFDFIIEVNGKKINFETKVIALLNDKDITKELKSYGFTDEQIALLPSDDFWTFHSSDHLSKAKFLQLQKKGVFETTPYGRIYPGWEVSIVYHWQQVFPANSTVVVKHSYNPLLSFSTLSRYFNTKEIESDYCATQPQIDALKKIQEQRKNFSVHSDVLAAQVDYILTTANSWKDDIRDFTMRIHTQSPEEMVSFCWGNPVVKVSETTYESRIKNFRPQKDLKICFLNTTIQFD